MNRANYRPQSTDTNIETDQYRFSLWRQQSVQGRLAQASRHPRGINALCLSGIKRRNPQGSLAAIRQQFALAKLLSRFEGMAMPCPYRSVEAIAKTLVNYSG